MQELSSGQEPVNLCIFFQRNRSLEKQFCPKDTSVGESEEGPRDRLQRGYFEANDIEV